MTFSSAVTMQQFRDNLDLIKISELDKQIFLCVVDGEKFQAIAAHYSLRIMSCVASYNNVVSYLNQFASALGLPLKLLSDRFYPNYFNELKELFRLAFPNG